MSSEATLADQIRAAIRELFNVDPAKLEPILESPADLAFGDFSCSVSMKLAKEAKQPPRKIAEALATKLASWKPAIAGAGYLNFTFPKTYHQEIAADAMKPGFGSGTAGAGIKVLIEHTSANPTGPLHIAHGRQAAVGDSLARIMKHAGYEVATEFYINDTGGQILNLGRSIYARFLESKGETLQVDGKPFLFDGSAENAYRGDYIKEIAKTVKEPATVEGCARTGKDQLLQEIKRDLEAFRVRFDDWFSEEALRGSGKIESMLEFFRSWGLTYEKDGALFLKTSSFGEDQDRPLIKTNKELVYRLPDLAYHRDKFDRGYDVLIDTWGPDHHAEITNRTAGLKALNFNLLPLDEFHKARKGGTPEQKARCFRVLIVQHCKLLKNGQEVKMGKRLASYVTLKELMEEVGVDATRWFFVMRKTDSHLDFDMTLAVQQSADNPVYYVQYAHARIASVFRKAAEKGFAVDAKYDAESLGDEEVLLLRHVRAFPKVVEKSARTLDQTLIGAYVHSLATAYQHYQTAGKKDAAKRILVDDEKLRNARLGTIAAVRATIKAALALIGVDAPEAMSKDED